MTVMRIMWRNITTTANRISFAQKKRKKRKKKIKITFYEWLSRGGGRFINISSNNG